MKKLRRITCSDFLWGVSIILSVILFVGSKLSGDIICFVAGVIFLAFTLILTHSEKVREKIDYE